MPEIVVRRPFGGYGRRSKDRPFSLYRWYRTGRECGLTLVRMPLEGQWTRQTTPIGELPQRVKRTVAIVVATLAAATAVTLAFALVHGDSAKAGCIRVAMPSTMGAGYVHACGDQAERTCAGQLNRPESDPFARAAHAECRRAGYPAPAASTG